MFITLKRTDIPNGTLLIRDLWPNQSQYNPVIDPLPQGPFYLSNPSNNAVATKANGNQRTISKTVTGLSAYLIATIEGDPVDPDNKAMTASEANASANAIIARMRAGNGLTVAEVNVILTAQIAGAENRGIGEGNSTGRLVDILAILAGATFTLPAGHEVQTAGNDFIGIPVNDIDSFFSGDKYQRLLTSDLAVSSAEGALSVMLTDNFTYLGVQAQAVVIYNNNGTVYDPQA
jgi:hypothetical protein